VSTKPARFVTRKALTCRETDEVRMATSGSFGNLVQYSFTFLFCFILAMWRAPILALVTLSTIPGVVLIQIIAQVLIGPMLEAERRAFAEASTNIERTTAAISTAKVHNAQVTEGDRFAPIIIKARDALVKQARVWAVAVGSSETLLLTTFVLGFWYGAIGHCNERQDFNGFTQDRYSRSTLSTYFLALLARKYSDRQYIRYQDSPDEYAPNSPNPMSWRIQFPECILLLPFPT
jgi:ABC-type multidrug transport system fused ATPase/permease subunit